METLGRAGLGRWNPQDIWSHKSTHTGWLGENGRVANIIGWGLQIEPVFVLKLQYFIHQNCSQVSEKMLNLGNAGVGDLWRRPPSWLGLAGPPPPMTGARPRGVPRCRGAARARILLDPGVHWRPDLVGPTGQ